jgi:hypothetical protein
VQVSVQVGVWVRVCVSVRVSMAVSVWVNLQVSVCEWEHTHVYAQCADTSTKTFMLQIAVIKIKNLCKIKLIKLAECFATLRVFTE